MKQNKLSKWLWRVNLAGLVLLFAYEYTPQEVIVSVANEYMIRLSF